MKDEILQGVGKKMRIAYLNGQISESVVVAAYLKNKKEADSFSVFGFKERELHPLLKSTHNPLLKAKLQEIIQMKRQISKKSNEQNKISLEKLDNFKLTACGVGLRKVIKRLKKQALATGDLETYVIQRLVELEFANLSAKKCKGERKAWCYRRKANILYEIADYLDELGWKYGINDNAGKNACYLVFVYLPNGVQLTWHCNEFGLYNSYPFIDDEWDGQVCMTMEKLVNYVSEKYYAFGGKQNQAA